MGQYDKDDLEILPGETEKSVMDSKFEYLVERLDECNSPLFVTFQNEANNYIKFPFLSYTDYIEAIGIKDESKAKALKYILTYCSSV